MSLNITIGTAPCSWGVWWADGSPSGCPAQTFLDQATQAGYKALELGPVGYLPTDNNELSEELKKRDLSVSGGTACFEFLKADGIKDVKDDIDAICKRLEFFGCKNLMCMDGCEIGRDEIAKLGDKKTKTYDLFGEVGKYTRETYGIEILMHPERCSLIETREDLLALIDRDLYICFDNGHFAAANGAGEFGDTSSFEFFKEYHDRLPYLHFKNYDAKLRAKELNGEIKWDDPAFKNLFTKLNEGAIDYVAYRDLLDSLDFEGVAIIEQDCPNSTPDEAFVMAKENLLYLKEIGMIS